MAIMLLVKESGPVSGSGAYIHYRDIGDYLTRDQKLATLDSALRSHDGTPDLEAVGWDRIYPNQHGDWINQRSESFATHMPINSTEEVSIFSLRTNGLKTNRDAWNYNASKLKLEAGVNQMIDHYNAQVDEFGQAGTATAGPQKQKATLAKEFADLDSTRFSWDHSDFQRMAKGEHYQPEDALYMTATYRPFYRRHVNAGRKLNNRVYQLPKVYPTAASDNLSICLPPPGSSAPPFSVLMTPIITDNGLYASSAKALFPQYLYQLSGGSSPVGLFDELDAASHEQLERRHNVTDEALASYQELNTEITKDDIFFYVYGLLHSRDYLTAYAADLRKSLPRIPRVDTAESFWEFSTAGRTSTSPTDLGSMPAPPTHTELKRCDTQKCRVRTIPMQARSMTRRPLSTTLTSQSLASRNGRMITRRVVGRLWTGYSAITE